MALIPGYPEVTVLHIAIGFAVGAATFFAQKKLGKGGFAVGTTAKIEAGTKHLIVSFVVSFVAVTAVIALNLV